MNSPISIGSATLYNCDCMEYMRGLPDKAFDLAIVDPPYGIGCDCTINIGNKKKGFSGNVIHVAKEWDKSIPLASYFSELERVSTNRIIWGGNYFTEFLPPTKGWIFWDKKINKNQGSNFSDGEMAWTSLKIPTRYFQYGWIGVDYCNQAEKKIHPTQKPVKLYEWLLTNYAKPRQRILDTHLGSMSSVIACLNMGFEITGCELDTDYFSAGVERVKQSQMQQRMFA
jgi:site-specific DNA-methyltransferase (adenine-specific)